MNPAAERAKYVFAVILYGTIGLFLRYVSIPSEIVAMCRGLIGGSFILVYLKARGQRLDREAIRRNLKWLVIAGVSLGLNWIFLFAAYMHTTVAIASLCNYMAPIIVILIAPLVLRERLDRRKMPAVAAAFVGIILVSGVWKGAAGSVSGVLMGLAAALCFVVIVICNRKFRDIPSLDRSVLQLLISAVTIFPYALVRSWGNPPPVDARTVLIVLMLGLLHTGVAYCFYFKGIGSLPVQTVAVLGYLEPVVSVLCSALFLREPLGAAGWIGAVLIIGAAVACELLGSGPSEAGSPEPG